MSARLAAKPAWARKREAAALVMGAGAGGGGGSGAGTGAGAGLGDGVGDGLGAGDGAGDGADDGASPPPPQAARAAVESAAARPGMRKAMDMMELLDCGYDKSGNLSIHPPKRSVEIHGEFGQAQANVNRM